jgi:hypothetical protein
MGAVGKIANGKGGTFVGKLPTAAGVTDGIVLGAGAVVGPVGAAAAPMRRGWLPLIDTVFVGGDARGATVAGNGAAVMPGSGFAANGGMGGVGKIANGKGGTFIGKLPTAAGVMDGIVLGAGAVVGPVGAAAAPMRRGLPPLIGTVFVGADARDATFGRLMGRVTAVGEGSPGVVGGQGKPAMR